MPLLFFKFMFLIHILFFDFSSLVISIVMLIINLILQPTRQYAILKGPKEISLTNFRINFQAAVVVINLFIVNLYESHKKNVFL